MIHERRVSVPKMPQQELVLALKKLGAELDDAAIRAGGVSVTAGLLLRAASEIDTLRDELRSKTWLVERYEADLSAHG